jgi:hypothetical protein
LVFQPAPLILDFAADNAKERLLKLLGNRAALANTDGDTVY